MTVDDAPVPLAAVSGTRPLTATAQELIADLLTNPWGQVSVSVYETGRLVTLAPWLTEHPRRIGYLLETQRPDGGWGGPGGYALVPTLSAMEALMVTLRRPPVGAALDATEAVDRGLAMLDRLMTGLRAADLPDMPAIDLIATSLAEAVNRQLPHVRPARRLPALVAVDDARLRAVRAGLTAGAAIPSKLMHALEVAGHPARGTSGAQPSATGAIGASPAATAAWLDGRAAHDTGNPARLFLEKAVSVHGGPVPCTVPITVFERAWTLATLVSAGVPVKVPAELTSSLETALEPFGAAAGDGLPQDADTTAVSLFALALLGTPYPPDSLWPYDVETHFCTWQGEDGFSTSVNAHALEAFGQYLAERPDPEPRYSETVRRLTTLLIDHQGPDGSWTDRWHASPYYATMSCALALARFGQEGDGKAVERAAQWTLETQRPDGSWGLWMGTAEETAYALRILTSAGLISTEAVRRGRAALLTCLHTQDGFPPLWHDKDLYAPTAIVQAAVLAALHSTDLGRADFRSENIEQHRR